MTGTPAATAFTVLDAVQVRRPDGTVAISGRKRQALLALLLLESGRTVSVDRLIEDLYSDGTIADAANALHAQVSRLRRLLLDTGAVIESGPAGYRLVVDPDAVDAHLFTRLAEEGRQALTTDPAAARALLARALDLWGGRDLPALPDASFLTEHVSRLVQLRLAAVEDHAEARIAGGEHVVAAAELTRLLDTHPLRERACALLMRALYASGQQARALALYERTRRALAAELGTDPSAELTAAYLAILRERPSPGPRRPPAQLTSFIGREDDLDRLTALLASERLVTLTGPGGTGKTRLAIEAAAATDGEAAFVELAPLTDARLLPQTLATALALNDPGLPSSAAEAHLFVALADRRLLIVLDNCEHVVDDIARLAARLLAACPGLRILATSRESLGLTGEVLFPVGQLAVAAADAPLPERLACPAVRLFTDRARTVQPGFRAGEDDVDDILRICAELDGLPLAIELAAARLRSLSPADVAAGLGDRFRLLSRGSRGADPRHQTLRAVAEWSWELLDPAERTLARRLTVFSGSATIASATAVCGLPAEDVPDLLAGLSEKSFVDYAGSRYRMLQTIRAFCAERLAEAGEDDRFHRSHTAYFRELAETADPQLRGPAQLEWLERLSAENDDLRAALRRTVQDDPRVALRMVAALSWYWFLRGLRPEGAALSAELMSRLGEAIPEGLVEEYALCTSNLTVLTDAGAAESAHLSSVIALTVDTAPRWPSTAVLCPSRVRPPAPDPWSQATWHLQRGRLHLVAGEGGDGEKHLNVALDAYIGLSDHWGTANALDSLAELSAWRGDWPSTLSLMGRAVEAARRFSGSSSAALIDLLCRRAKVHLLAGDVTAAGEDLDEAAVAAAHAGRRREVPELHQGLGDIARLRGDLAEARANYERALAGASKEWDTRAIRLKSLRGLGWIAVSDGRVADADRYHRLLLDEAVGNGNPLLAADAVTGLAGVALLKGDPHRAALLLGAARAVHGARMAEGADWARVAGETRALIGARAYEAAFAEGEGLVREDAVAVARG